MNEQQNLSIVRKAYDAFGRGDIPGLLSLLDDRVSWVTPGPADLPTAGTRKGHDAVQQFFQALSGLVDIVRFEPKEFIAQGDRVVVIGDDTTRVKATGRTIEFRWVHAFTVLINGAVVSRTASGCRALLCASHALGDWPLNARPIRLLIANGRPRRFFSLRPLAADDRPGGYVPPRQ